MKKVVLADQDRIDAYEDTAREFFRSVLDMDYGECVVTDERRLSDFSSYGLPDGLGDVSTYPALFEELATRGYIQEDLSKIAGGNVLRVMREAERVSAKQRSERPPSSATIEELDG